ncbi:MAG: OmpH family outer membrane protein [Armatimonadota bacterium]|nr:OmpH family outer membrane protein [bacterium]
MAKSRRTAWALVMIIAGVVLAGTAAIAADQQNLKIGIVDLEKIYNTAPRVKQYTESLNVFRQDLATKLDIRSQNLMLNENEIKELIDLKLKPSATDKDKTRIQEIEDLERSRDGEYKTLQSTKEPNDQQKARQKELQDMQQKSKDTGNALAKDYDGQLQSKMQELNGKAETDIREAINKFASSKGFQIVLAKEAVLFGGTDISDDVIKNLDRKAQ